MAEIAMATITLAITPVAILPVRITTLVSSVVLLIVVSEVVPAIGGDSRFVAVCIVVLAAFLWNPARSWRRQGTENSLFCFSVAVTIQKMVAEQLMTAGGQVCRGIVKGLSRAERN